MNYLLYKWINIKLWILIYKIIEIVYGQDHATQTESLGPVTSVKPFDFNAQKKYGWDALVDDLLAH